MTDSYGQWL